MRYVVYLCVIVFLLHACDTKRNINNSENLLAKKSIPIIDSFFNLIRDGNYEVSLTSLLKGNEYIDLKDSATILMQSNFKLINESSGEFVSDSLMRSKNIGNDVVVYSYLVKYSRKYYRFLFTFYNNGKQVKIFKFSFDDTINIELEDAIRLYVN